MPNVSDSFNDWDHTDKALSSMPSTKNQILHHLQKKAQMDEKLNTFYKQKKILENEFMMLRMENILKNRTQKQVIKEQGNTNGLNLN